MFGSLLIALVTVYVATHCPWRNRSHNLQLHLQASGVPEVGQQVDVIPGSKVVKRQRRVERRVEKMTIWICRSQPNGREVQE